MRHLGPLHSGKLGIALLVIALLGATAPVAACGVAGHCPMTSIAHGGCGMPAGHGTGPHAGANHTCCKQAVAQEVATAPSILPASGFSIAAMTPVGSWLAPMPRPAAAFAPSPPRGRPAGRDLLALEQTLLI